MAQVTNRIVNQVETNTGNSEQQIQKLESSISTLDGAINLVGGSVEFLAGALVLSGAASEETAEQFESVALGAIAVADGANRALQGYKILKTETQIINNIQKAFNKTLLANPYVAVAVALGTLTAAIGAYLLAQDKEIAGLEKVNKNLAKNVKLSDSAKDGIASQTAELRVLERIIKDETLSEERRNKALKELQEILPELEGLDLNRADAIDQVSQAIGREIFAIQKRAEASALEERLTSLYRERQDAVEGAIEASNGLIKSEEELRIFLAFNQGQINKQGTAFQKYAQSIRDTDDDINETSESLVTLQGLIAELTKTTNKQTEAQKDLNEEIGETVKLAPKQAQVTTETAGATVLATTSTAQAAEEITESTTAGYANAALAFLGFLDEQNEKLLDFYESDTAEAISATLGTAAQFTDVLAQSVDDSTKEGFEASKKYKIASVTTSAIQSAFEAFGAAQQFGPILGPILGAAQVAAIGIAANTAINDIRSSQFGGGGNPNVGGISTPSPSVGGAAGGGGVPAIPGFGTSGITTLNAVVLAGDVTSAQAQDAAIRNRRRFGRGG